MTSNALYFVSWTLTSSGCTGMVPWMGFKCEGNSTRMEYVDADIIFTPGYQPKCNVVPGTLEGFCTIDLPATDTSFAIGTGTFFRCYGDDPSQLVGSAFLPAQVGQCFWMPNVMTHLLDLSLVCGNPYAPEDTTIFKDLDCLEGWTLDSNGDPKCLDIDGCLVSGTYLDSCLSALTERNVRQNTIPDEFADCSVLPNSPTPSQTTPSSTNPSPTTSSLTPSLTTFSFATTPSPTTPNPTNPSQTTVSPTTPNQVTSRLDASSTPGTGRIMAMHLLNLMLAYFVLVH